MPPIMVDAFKSIGFDLFWNCHIDIDEVNFKFHDASGDNQLVRSEWNMFRETTPDFERTIELLDADSNGVITLQEAIDASPIPSKCKPVS